MTVTSILRMYCLNRYSHSGRGSSDVSMYIKEMVHLKVSGSDSISSSVFRIFQFLHPQSACVQFHRNGVEAL